MEMCIRDSPYPLSAAVSLPLSPSFLGMPKFWMKSIIKEDTVTVISEYTIRPAGIYDRDLSLIHIYHGLLFCGSNAYRAEKIDTVDNINSL